MSTLFVNLARRVSGSKKLAFNSHPTGVGFIVQGLHGENEPFFLLTKIEENIEEAKKNIDDFCTQHNLEIVPLPLSELESVLWSQRCIARVKVIFPHVSMLKIVRKLKGYVGKELQRSNRRSSRLQKLLGKIGKYQATKDFNLEQQIWDEIYQLGIDIDEL